MADEKDPLNVAHLGDSSNCHATVDVFHLKLERMSYFLVQF